MNVEPNICDVCDEPFSDGVPCACDCHEADAAELSRAQHQLAQLEEVRQ